MAEQQAFPSSYIAYGDHNEEEHRHLSGMTLRDYFAAKAMAALAADKLFDPGRVEKPASIIAKFAYQIADEMMKARE